MEDLGRVIYHSAYKENAMMLCDRPAPRPLGHRLDRLFAPKSLSVSASCIVQKWDVR